MRPVPARGSDAARAQGGNCGRRLRDARRTFISMQRFRLSTRAKGSLANATKRENEEVNIKQEERGLRTDNAEDGRIDEGYTKTKNYKQT